MSMLSTRRYLSVWLRRLSTDRIERRLSKPKPDEPAQTPRVVAGPVKAALRLTAVNDAAARLGLKPGMPLADVRAMYPTIAVAEADAEADSHLLEAIADWTDRYTPLVGLDTPDGLLLDVTGCAHLFHGEAAMCRDLVARLAAQGFSARVAVADTVGCAWGMARYGTPGVVPRGEAAAAMSPLPVAALRVEPEIVAGLATAGLKRVSDLAARPRAPFAARFGDGLMRRLDQALGRADEPIMPRLPVPAAMAEQRFPEPVAREDDVLGTVENLARQLAIVLERRGEGARLLQLALFRADGLVHRLELGTGEPVRDAVRVRRLFQDRLAVLGDACDPGFGFDVIRLCALVTERSDPAQTGWTEQGHAENPHDDDLAHLIDRLGARFGLRRITRPVPQDTHIPEFAVMAVPAHRAKTLASLHPAIEQDSLVPIRPVRLFERPELIEVVNEVPDGAPARFRWRHVWHNVAHTDGPERIALEWWHDKQGQNLERDYFRVESRAGMRVWLYREGRYRSDERDVKNLPRWYVQGLFA